LWDAKTGEILQPSFEGHEDWVSAVAISPDGNIGKHTMSGSALEEQPLIHFSPHSQHALIGVAELLHDSTPLSQHKLMDLVKVTSSGWVYIGLQNKLLLWIPSIYHLLWYSPSTHMIIPVPNSQLDLSNMAHGSSWELCYSKKT